MIRKVVSFFSRDIPYMVVIGVLYLIIAGAYLKTHSYVGTDGCVYAIGTENIAQGQGFTRYGRPLTVYMPLYSYVAAAWYWVLGSGEHAARWVSIVSALLSIPFLFYLVRRLFEVRAARIATLLIFTNKEYMKISSDVLVEGLFILLVLAALYVFVCHIWLRHRRGSVVLPMLVFSLLSGLATLTRPDGLLLYILVLVFYVATKVEAWKVRLATVILSLFCFFLVLVPQLSYQYGYTGKLQITDKARGHLLSGDLISFQDREGYFKKGSFKIYETMEMPLPEELNRVPESSEFDSIEFVLSNKARLLKRSLHNGLQLLGLLQKGVIFTIMWIFLFIGIVVGLRTAKYRLQLLLLGILVLPVIPLSFLHFELRYVLPQILVLLIISAFGISQLIGFLKQNQHKVKQVVLVVVMVLLVCYPFAKNYRYLKDINEPNQYQIYKNAGRWLKEQLSNPAGAHAVAMKPWICYYAGVQCEIIPWVESVELLVEYLQTIEADFLIVQKSQVEDKRPTLKKLLDEKSEIAGLVAIYADVDEEEDEKIVIYRVGDAE